MTTHDGRPMDLDEFIRNTERCASAIGAGFSRSMTEKVVDAFREHLLDPNGFIWYKNTTIPRSPLSYRFLRGNYPAGTDLVALGRSFGTWQETEKHFPQMYEVVPNLFAKHAGATKWMGNDFHADSGPSKVYLWLGTELKLRDLDKHGMPSAVAKLVPLMEEVGIDQVRMVGIDYQRASINLYMYDGPREFTHERLEKLLGRTFPNSAPPDRLAECEASFWGIPVGLALTFSWNADALDRWCIYSHGLVYGVAPPLPPGLTLPPTFKLPKMPERFSQLNDVAGGYLPFPVHDFSWVWGNPQFHMKYDRTYFGSPYDIGKYFGFPPSREEALKGDSGA